MRALVSSWLAPLDHGGDFGRVKRSREPLLLAIVARALPEAWPSDARRTMSSDNVSVGVLADNVVEEDVLGNDGIAFHAHHLGDVGDAPGAVAQAGSLDDDVDRGADHLANGSGRQRKSAHRDHRFAT